MKAYKDDINKKVKNADNARILADFVDHSIATGKSGRRIDRYIDALYPMSNRIGKPFRDMGKADVQEYIKELVERKDYADWTKYTYQVIIKNCFFPWLYGTDRGEYPEMVKWMRPRVPSRNNKQSRKT
ncbi:MAG: phage integrase N-terminal SAM-like domain-containing protein [Candidatus Aenigmarchaeota archaeon]|nr:phage integrase N-terminal SAM-like domain-containing protein [Candidatus Aenigmarchaeota archaeon]